jgi:DNA-directed RNA polymerase I subunit RPA43
MYMSPSIDGEFQVVRASLVLSVPPIFAANPRAGVEELLDSMIMRYIVSINPCQNPTIFS